MDRTPNPSTQDASNTHSFHCLFNWLLWCAGGCWNLVAHSLRWIEWRRWRRRENILNLTKSLSSSFTSLLAVWSYTEAAWPQALTICCCSFCIKVNKGGKHLWHPLVTSFNMVLENFHLFTIYYAFLVSKALFLFTGRWRRRLPTPCCCVWSMLNKT